MLCIIEDIMISETLKDDKNVHLRTDFMEKGKWDPERLSLPLKVTQ
jgi:hypothetical protein